MPTSRATRVTSEVNRSSWSAIPLKTVAISSISGSPVLARRVLKSPPRTAVRPASNCSRPDLSSRGPDWTLSVTRPSSHHVPICTDGRRGSNYDGQNASLAIAHGPCWHSHGRLLNWPRRPTDTSRMTRRNAGAESERRGFPILSGSDDEVTRLIAVIERQRRELDRIRASAVSQAMVAMARGALMERLGLSSAEAASQLAELSAATGVPLGEMAVAVLSTDELAAPGPSTDPAGPGVPGPGETGTAGLEAAEWLRGPAGESDRRPRATRARCWPRRRPSRPLTAPSWPAPWLAQVLAPLGAAAVAIWLLEADGALALLGEAGPVRRRGQPLAAGPAAAGLARPSGWRVAGPTCGVERRPAGRPTACRSPARPDGARAVLALRERSGELLGVMGSAGRAAGRIQPRGPPAPVLAAAAGCATGDRAPGSPHGSWPPRSPEAACTRCSTAWPSRCSWSRPSGTPTGRWRLQHRARQPRLPRSPGRAGVDLTRLTLLGGLSGQRAPARACSPGPARSWRTEWPVSPGRWRSWPRAAGDEADPRPALALRVARFFDGVIFTWHGLAQPTAGRRAWSTRSGSAVWAAGRRTSSPAVRWTDSAFDLFGLAPGRWKSRSRMLHSYVMAADKPVVKRFRQRLPERREATDRDVPGGHTPTTGASARSASSPSR